MADLHQQAPLQQQADLHQQQAADIDLRLIAHVVTTMRGRPPAGYWYAPGVINWLQSDTTAVASATQWGAVVAGELNTEGVYDFRSINRPSEGSRGALSDADGISPMVAETLAWQRAGQPAVPVDLLGWTDVPVGVGPLTGAALSAATALALRDLSGCAIDIAALGATVCPDSSDAVRASLILQADEVLVSSAEVVSKLPFALTDNLIRVLVIDTRERAEPVVFSDTDEVVDSGIAALHAGDLTAFGQAVSQAHTQACGSGLSTAQQDSVVAAAVGGGALGARAISDGKGRPVVALVPRDAMPAVRAAVLSAFAEKGWRAPRFLTASTVRPAHRIA